MFSEVQIAGNTNEMIGEQRCQQRRAYAEEGEHSFEKLGDTELDMECGQGAGHAPARSSCREARR